MMCNPSRPRLEILRHGPGCEVEPDKEVVKWTSLTGPRLNSRAYAYVSQSEERFSVSTFYFILFRLFYLCFFFSITCTTIHIHKSEKRKKFVGGYSSASSSSSTSSVPAAPVFFRS